jgi:hypothetical protein
VVARDWSAAREKVEREGRCRVCGSRERLQAAHVIGRQYDVGLVNPHDIVPLCSYRNVGTGGCHQAYDRRALDLLPYLSYAEQSAAVAHVGIIGAQRRICGVLPDL